MSGKKLEYYNFPIQLLGGFMIDPMKSLTSILSYNIEKYARNSISIDHGELPLDRVYEWMDLPISESNFLDLYEHGKTLYNSIPENSPSTGIRIEVFFDYCNNGVYKTKYELIALVAHLALKSILGKSSWKKVNYDFWFSRMDGHTNSVPHHKLSLEIAEFYTDYKKRKIRDKLELNWNLQWVRTGGKGLNFRGLIVSYKMNHIELYEKAVSLKEDSQLKKMKNKKKLELEQHLKKKKENS